MSGSLYRIDGAEFKVEKRGRSWEVSFDCVCALGPHWHLLGIHSTRAACEEQIGWRGKTTRAVATNSEVGSGSGMAVLILSMAIMLVLFFAEVIAGVSVAFEGLP